MQRGLHQLRFTPTCMAHQGQPGSGAAHHCGATSSLLVLHKRGGSAEPDRPAPSCHTHAPTPPAPRTTGQPTQCRMTGAYPGLQHGPGSQVLLLHLAIGHQGTKDAQPFLAEAAPEVSQQILQAQSSADEGQRCWHAQCQCTWVCLVMDNRVS